MTILSDVEKLVGRLAPAPVCDTCLTTTLGLGTFAPVEQAARELAGANGYERGKDTCCLCGETRMVIRRR